jgi:hypothetical protein
VIGALPRQPAQDRYGLDPALKPTRLDISETVRWLAYKPAYSLANLLSELAAFGDSGPPHITEN